MALPPVPRLPRKNTLLFADNSQRIAKFGSLANGSGLFTRDIDEIQNLPAFLTGWLGAIVDENAPTLEDMDALFYTLFRQIAYFAQSGIAEFSQTMTYYANSIVQFRSLTYMCFDDSNGAGITGISPDDHSRWRRFSNVSLQKIQADSTLRRNTDGDAVLVDSSKGRIRLTLPPPLRGWQIEIKDSGFKADVNPITFVRTPGRKIENIDSDYLAESPGGVWRIASDGTDYFILKKNNPVIKELNIGNSWVAPAGVYEVGINVITKRNKLVSCGDCSNLSPVSTLLGSHSSIVAGSYSGNSLMVSVAGSNSIETGQLGINKNTLSAPYTQIEIFPPDSINRKNLEIIDLSTSGFNSYIVLSDGRVFGCGMFGTVANPTGELGSSFTPKPGDTKVASSFIDISKGLPPITQVSAGSRFVLFLDSKGDIYGSGLNAKKQLGPNAAAVQPGIRKLFDGTKKYVKISAGVDHSLAIDDNGDLWEWGNLNTVVANPRRIGQEFKWIDISAGDRHSLAVNTLNDVYAWGINSHGQLGDGSPISNTYRPTIAKCFTVSKFKNVGARLGFSSIGVTVDGDICRWGLLTDYLLDDNGLYLRKEIIDQLTPLTYNSGATANLLLNFSYAEICNEHFVALSVNNVVYSNLVVDAGSKKLLKESFPNFSNSRDEGPLQTIQVTPGEVFEVSMSNESPLSAISFKNPYPGDGADANIPLNSTPLVNSYGINKSVKLKYLA